MGCFGGGGNKSDPNAAASVALQREQVQKQYEYDVAQYDFQWEGNAENPEGQAWREFNHTVAGHKNQIANDTATRAYQEQTNMQNWEQGLAIADYQHAQQNRVYTKSEQQYAQQRSYNEQEMEAAISREKDVLNEQFIESAFQNQGVIQDFFEDVGGKGFDKISTTLGLQGATSDLNYQKNKALLNTAQFAENTRFDLGQQKLDLLNNIGQTEHQKVSLANELGQKLAQNKLDETVIDVDARTSKSRADFENTLLRRELQDSKSKAAFDLRESQIESLRKLGQAGLSQAGRSQGKGIQMVLAEFGRMNAFTVESIVRSQKTAVARMKNNRVNALNTQAKAMIAKKKIDFDSLQAIADTKLDIAEADRGLKISGSKSELDMNKIRKELLDVVEITDVDVKNIDQNIKQKQAEAGFDVKKIDWDLENLGTRFKTNQEVIAANLESAAKTSLSNQQDIIRARYQADLEAEARRMLEPERAPDPVKPLSLPETQYVDPLEPQKPPEPIKGAMAKNVSTGSGGFGAANAIGSIVNGISTGMSIGALGAGMGPVGWAVGIGTALFG